MSEIRSMDFILLSDSQAVVDGLGRMLEFAFEDGHSYTDSKFVDVQTALLIVEIAKRSADRPEWFQRGKWATIQAIQSRIDEQIASLRYE